MIPWLDHTITEFPDIDTALDEPNGLLAAGGDLSSERLIEAYKKGVFPWFSPGEPILWWSPDPRCVLFPEQLHISRSMKKRLKKQDYKVLFDHNFPAVIEACSQPRSDENGTWITQEMKQAYCQLHAEGIAHSVEVYIDDQLCGGLYGLAIGKLFFGESMFSRQRDASKIAFISLAQQLEKWGYQMIDCQVSNDHLFSLGATEITRKEFKRQLCANLYLTRDHRWVFDE